LGYDQLDRDEVHEQTITYHGPLAATRLDFDRHVPDDLRLVSLAVLSGMGLGAPMDLRPRTILQEA
jgi:hypothetical protein